MAILMFKFTYRHFTNNRFVYCQADFGDVESEMVCWILVVDEVIKPKPDPAGSQEKFKYTGLS